MKKIFLAAVLAACLCLSACSERTTSNLEYNSGVGVNSPAQSSAEMSEEKESNNSDIYSQDTTSKPDTSASDSVIVGNEKEYNQEEQTMREHSMRFKKIKVGVNADFEYGVFAQDVENQLYFGTSNDTMELIDTEVKDFSYTVSGLYVLKENGNIFCAETDEYREGQPFSVFYQNSNATQISDTVLTLLDGSVLVYSTENSSWEQVDVTASMVDADCFGAAIIDRDGVLWYLNRRTSELSKISENVVDCSYKDRNKVYYSDDLWYLTEDKRLHLYQTDSDEDVNFDFPDNITAVSGCRGQYIASQTNGNMLYGDLSSNLLEIGIKSQEFDLFGIYYAILDEDGIIHFGTLQLNQGMEEDARIVHP